jgi:hypothetical protein
VKYSKRLSLQIKSLVKIVEVQKYRSGNQHAPHNDVLSNEDDIQKALLNIAKGIVNKTEEHFEGRPAPASSAPVTRSSRQHRRRIPVAPNTENVDSSLLPYLQTTIHRNSGADHRRHSCHQPYNLVRPTIPASADTKPATTLISRTLTITKPSLSQS